MPDSTQTLTIPQALQLAIQHHQAERLQQAETIYRQVLELEPENSIALHLLGVVAYQVKNYDVASGFISKAIQISPNIPTFYNSLGNVHSDYGPQLDKAIECYKKVIALDSKFYEAHRNLGSVFWKQGKLTKAIKCYQRALALKPDFIDAIISLGIAFMDQGKLNQAIDCCQRALKLNPNSVEAHSNLSKVLHYSGKVDEAIEHYRLALQIKPIAQVHSNLLLAMSYSTKYDMATIFAEHKRFNEQHIVPLVDSVKSYPNERSFKRKLKIGYVSADFRDHPVAIFVEAILAQHDREQFEIFCYYSNLKGDSITQHLQQYVDHWLNCAGLPDENLAAQIQSDQIDILVDLAGHTAKNRLPVFARKPAPIQVTYLGYPNTTGLKVIDYRITDSYVVPPEAEEFNTETLVKLPNSYYCYYPNAATPPVSKLPATKNDYVVFGSFNNYAKLNSDTLSLWAKVLQAVPEAKLLVKATSLQTPTIQQDLRQRLLDLGIKSKRIILESPTPSPKHFQSYHRVDIGLDTYPFNGGTTTCEALWMGIPVVTLVGERQVSRMGLGILSTIGLTELIAYTPEKFVEICVKLAADIEHLDQLRMGMRERMRVSPLMDAPTFTRNIETAYRNMWEKWSSENNK